MKKFFISAWLLSLIGGNVFAQFANQSLSNLTAPTQINQNLTPKANKTTDLGSGSKSWRDLYISGSLHIGGSSFLSQTNYAGYNNIALGVDALKANTIGFSNTASGFAALYDNTTGNDNTASGFESLYSNTSGFFNTANGYLSLYSNTLGVYNTASGSQALYSNTTGTGNTANGTYSLDLNTAGIFNTAFGYASLNSNTTGNYNTAIGFDSNPVDGSISNYTGIGNMSGSNASASNMVEIGNTSVNVIRGEVNFSTYSDERIKNNIRDNVPGLAFINLLKPVTYHLDIHKQNQMLYAGKTINGKSADMDYPGKYDLENQQMTGFIAQDVESAAEAVNYDFSGVVKPQNEHDLYSLRYSDFVVPLVQAVQELSTKNDSLQSAVRSLQQENQKMQNEIDELKSTMSDQLSTISSSRRTVDAPRLEQNTPNPFSQNTTIQFYIPSSVSDAMIIVTDLSGKTIQQFSHLASGNGTITIASGTLSSGTYQYSLLVNGKVIDTRQMELLK